MHNIKHKNINNCSLCAKKKSLANKTKLREQQKNDARDLKMSRLSRPLGENYSDDYLPEETELEHYRNVCNMSMEWDWSDVSDPESDYNEYIHDYVIDVDDCDN